MRSTLVTAVLSRFGAVADAKAERPSTAVRVWLLAAHVGGLHAGAVSQAVVDVFLGSIAHAVPAAVTNPASSARDDAVVLLLLSGGAHEQRERRKEASHLAAVRVLLLAAAGPAAAKRRSDAPTKRLTLSFGRAR